MAVISSAFAERGWADSRIRALIGQFEPLYRCGSKLGPYVVLELLLPGGTLFALLFYLYQRRKPNGAGLSTLIGLADFRSKRDV